MHITAANMMRGAVPNAFTPSAYETDLTMNGTAQTIELQRESSLIRILNRGATTEAIRVAFGISSADAGANLVISTGAATEGYYIAALADSASAEQILGIPANATHIAVANAVASDVQVVSVTQGV